MMRCIFITLFFLLVVASANAQDNKPSCDTTVAVPKVFAPCGDGPNVLFLPAFTLLQPVEYYFAVYNRWGELLFETETLHDGWTGHDKRKQLAGDGVYVWKLRYRYAGDITRECSGQVNFIC